MLIYSDILLHTRSPKPYPGDLSLSRFFVKSNILKLEMQAHPHKTLNPEIKP